MRSNHDARPGDERGKGDCADTQPGSREKDDSGETKRRGSMAGRKRVEGRIADRKPSLPPWPVEALRNRRAFARPGAPRRQARRICQQPRECRSDHGRRNNAHPFAASHLPGDGETDAARKHEPRPVTHPADGRLEAKIVCLLPPFSLGLDHRLPNRFVEFEGSPCGANSEERQKRDRKNSPKTLAIGSCARKVLHGVEKKS